VEVRRAAARWKYRWINAVAIRLVAIHDHARARQGPRSGLQD
jgi:hypothetical protein